MKHALKVAAVLVAAVASVSMGEEPAGSPNVLSPLSAG